MFIIKNKFIFLTLSALLVMGSLVAIFTKGFNMGIDFTGGSVLEVAYDIQPNVEELQSVFTDLGYPGSLQPFGENNIVIRTHDLTEEERVQLLNNLSFETHEPQLVRSSTVGPSVGHELRSKAIISIILVLIGIILFISYAFRNINRGRGDKRTGPSSWKYGIFTIVALLHDVIIPAGIFALLGLEINSLFVVGLLSVLGLSVHDTIVVFDRIRESAQADSQKNLDTPFSTLVGNSVVQTLGRSINTSLTIMITLLVLFLVGPETTKGLALVMFIGTFVGIYSSIFVASPLLVLSYKPQKS